jgi:hypothetical protein
VNWIFDGTQWSEISQVGPSPRSGAVMSYDDNIGQLILFGGNPVISSEKDYNGPMWSWDGKSWHQIPVHDSLVFNTCMAFDIAEHLLIRFGGWTGKIRTQDTWSYDTLWTKLEIPISPAARNHSVMVYDKENGECILFGGHDGDQVFGDMWAFKNGHWVIISDEKPLKRVDNGH